MKEYQSKQGGRYLFNEDFENLQELALSMTEMFKKYGVNFVLSGCQITVEEASIPDTYNVSVSEGFVYISGKIRKVEAGSFENVSVGALRKIYIVETLSFGPTITYADGSSSRQYNDYKARLDVGIDYPSQTSIKIQEIAEGAEYTFPDFKTGFLSACGALNEGMFVDVEATEQFTFGGNKIYTIGGYPAQFRMLKMLVGDYDGFSFPDNEALEENKELFLSHGIVTIIPANRIEYLKGNYSIYAAYFKNAGTVSFEVVVIDKDCVEGDSIATFEITPTENNKTIRYVIDNELASTIKNYYNSNSDIQGVAFRITNAPNGQTDPAYIIYSGSSAVYTDLIEFGITKKEVPENLYRFFIDSNNLCETKDVIVYNNSSNDEKNAWKERLGQQAISTEQLQDDCVDGDKIQPKAIGTVHINDDAIILKHLAPSLQDKINFFVELEQVNQFTLNKNKVYTIKGVQAQYRMFSRIHGEDIRHYSYDINDRTTLYNAGVVTFVPANEIEYIVGGKTKWNVYFKIQRQFQFAITVVNSDFSLGQDLTTLELFPFIVNGSLMVSQVISNEIATLINDYYDSNDDILGVCFRIINLGSGESTDPSSYLYTGSTGLISDVIDFGAITNGNVPNFVYRYYYTNSENTIECSDKKEIYWMSLPVADKWQWSPNEDYIYIRRDNNTGSLGDYFRDLEREISLLKGRVSALEGSES